MAGTTFYVPRRRAVELTTSWLDQRIEDHDCTDTSFGGAVPLDGQWVLTSSSGQERIALHAAAGTYAAWQGAAITDVTAACLDKGHALAMVWTSGSTRSDIQALGSKRVPVLRGTYKVRTKAFHCPDNSDVSGSGWTGTKPSNSGYTAGQLLTVVAKTIGGVARLVLQPLYNTNSGVAVARVVRVIEDSTVVGQAEVEIEVFSAPQIINR